MNPSADYKEDLKNCLEVLSSGGVIIYPTDTIWGIGCDATNEEAVEKVYRIKKRHDSKSMLILLDNENRIPSYIQEVPEVAWELMDVSNKPITLILPGARNLAKNLISSDGTVGIRLSKEPFSQELIRRFGKPIVSTSANFSGEASPGNYDDISEELSAQADYVVNYRRDEIAESPPSSIISLGLGGEIRILRK